MLRNRKKTGMRKAVQPSHWMPRSATQAPTIMQCDECAEIYYTTDGSVPTQATGNLYSTPLIISTTTNLQFIACDAQMPPNCSSVESVSYLIDV